MDSGSLSFVSSFEDVLILSHYCLYVNKLLLVIYWVFLVVVGAVVAAGVGCASETTATTLWLLGR